ncbi:MAG: adenylate kinase [Clostridia bacterium]|jgi:adenylate kinase|nr:adenylate kinase [Clostridia bacterium]
MYIVMLGAPGSGKGSAAKILARETNLPHISTGDIFREQIKKETELGKLANSYISKGQLVPDEVTIHIVKDRLSWEDAKNGIILDGFPRTIEQAKALDDILKEQGNKITLVPELIIPDQIIIERILNRATCSNKECGAIYNTKFKPPKVEGICDICGAPLSTRIDDSEETIKNRLEVYREKSKDLIAYYEEKGALTSITPEDPTAGNASEQVVKIILEMTKRK